MVMHSGNPSTWEDKEGEFEVKAMLNYTLSFRPIWAAV